MVKPKSMMTDSLNATDKTSGAKTCLMGGAGLEVNAIPNGPLGWYAKTPTDGALTDGTSLVPGSNNTLAGSVKCAEAHKGAAFTESGGDVSGGVTNTAMDNSWRICANVLHLPGLPNIYKINAHVEYIIKKGPHALSNVH